LLKEIYCHATNSNILGRELAGHLRTINFLYVRRMIVADLYLSLLLETWNPPSCRKKWECSSELNNTPHQSLPIRPTQKNV
jgi:hypothetical protein